MTTITLDADEALVLCELLARENKDRRSARIPGVIDHPAEFWVLNSVFGNLQHELVEPFKDEYREIVASARERILDQTVPERTIVIGSA